MSKARPGPRAHDSSSGRPPRLRGCRSWLSPSPSRCSSWRCPPCAGCCTASSGGTRSTTQGFALGPVGGRLSISVLVSLPRGVLRGDGRDGPSAARPGPRPLRSEIICVGDDNPATESHAREIADDTLNVTVVVRQGTESKPHELRTPRCRHARPRGRGGHRRREPDCSGPTTSKVDATLVADGADARPGGRPPGQPPVDLVELRHAWSTGSGCGPGSSHTQNPGSSRWVATRSSCGARRWMRSAAGTGTAWPRTPTSVYGSPSPASGSAAPMTPPR